MIKPNSIILDTSAYAYNHMTSVHRMRSIEIIHPYHLRDSGGIHTLEHYSGNQIRFFFKEDTVNILVCVKQVPDTETIVKIADDGKSIDESEVNFVINPYDEFAVEEAIRLKEEHGGEVTIVTLGPEDATSAMRNALAMGADRGILLTTENARMADSYAIASALASAIREIDYDIILCGKKSVDSDHHQVGPMLATLLDIPCVSTIHDLSISNENFTASRDIEGGTETYEGTLPAVFTADKSLNDPRYAALKGIMQAKKKPIDTREAKLPEETISIDSMEYPPESPPGKIVGEGPDAVPELVRLLKNEAKVL